ncbi:MAG: SDR family oxidoreductase [Lachnospiraceae bacterium]|nr:SDR family oxidoreductase [Lachnospiraceae bacterium]
MRGLKDKIAVVTGGAKGIGKGVALRLAQEGTNIVVADILEEEAQKTAAELQGLGVKAEAFKVNLCEENEILALMEHVHKTYGRIDILVCVAGVQIRDWATDFDTAKFDFLMNVNLRAYYLCSRTAARYMKEQGKGSIVCISSGNSERFTTKRSPYNISKAAVNGLVATLGVEWGRFGIRINAVAPGYVETDLMMSGVKEGIIDLDNIMKVIPMKRLLSTEEIGNGVAFLASDEASGVTGQTLFVDGGWSKSGLPEEKDMD